MSGIQHTITISEEEREMFLMALADLSVERPQCLDVVRLIARRMASDRLFEQYRRLHSDAHLPIQLVWIEGDREWVTTVPAKDYLGVGKYIIHAIQRPGYCDRGKWHVLVESYGVAGLDDQEGFPRYYFRLQHLQREMALWVNEREACKAAAAAVPPPTTKGT